jgi:hypothetical protein
MNFILAVSAIVFESLLGIEQSKESFFVYDKILTKITPQSLIHHFNGRFEAMMHLTEKIALCGQT